MSTHQTAPRTAAGLLVALVLSGMIASGDGADARQAATPAADPCAAAPTAEPDGMAGMATGTPAADTVHDMAGMAMATTTVATEDAAAEFDRLYIDGMIPHHASIIPVARAALPRLTDERLREVARAIVAMQAPEIEELRGYRARFYGSPDAAPMDEQTMAAMERAMPGTGAMMAQMDPAAEVATFCAAEDPDLAFIDLTIPHHRSAIEMSETALGQATHDEIRAFAERVIRDQQRELDVLGAVRAQLYGSATPEPVDGESESDGHDGHGAMPRSAAAELPIRALPAETVEQIERGQGAGFALPAERNGVPGPSHVLELADRLGLSGDQRAQTRAVFDGMRAGAILAGARYLDAERALEADLRDGAVDEAELAARVAEVSRLEGELAAIHLVAHVKTASILTPDQVAAYNRLRPAS